MGSSPAASVATTAALTVSTMPAVNSSSSGSAVSAPAAPVVSLASAITIKLTGENYLFWRAQVAPLLRSHLLMGYVDGTKPCPAAEIAVSNGEATVQQPNPAYSLWVQQDQSILSAFVSSMTEGVVGMILFAATAREAWETLSGAFASVSIARSSGIRQQMSDLKKNNLSVNDRIADARYRDMAGSKGKSFTMRHCFDVLYLQWQLRDESSTKERLRWLRSATGTRRRAKRPDRRREKGRPRRGSSSREAALLRDKFDQMMKSKEVIAAKTLETKLVIIETKKEVSLAKLEASKQGTRPSWRR
ncbi:hypothetical protein QYE76_050705 [Lolium multiflorum]|uniref:Retrotransposon Copia-like N-terminal domain-containing protein n=1 Tax=Lolium multiflorum TaxID=4521 RepID=A0AAD8WI27_LOLMU|nr:hypothetical protein QYE76_050705 [Lolium multiflorum]